MSPTSVAIRIFSWMHRNPVRTYSIVGAALTCLLAFGLALTTPQTVALLGLAAVILGVPSTALHNRVTPWSPEEGAQTPGPENDPNLILPQADAFDAGVASAESNAGATFEVVTFTSGGPPVPVATVTPDDDPDDEP